MLSINTISNMNYQGQHRKIYMVLFLILAYGCVQKGKENVLEKSKKDINPKSNNVPSTVNLSEVSAIDSLDFINSDRFELPLYFKLDSIMHDHYQYSADYFGGDYDFIYDNSGQLVYLTELGTRFNTSKEEAYYFYVLAIYDIRRKSIVSKYDITSFTKSFYNGLKAPPKFRSYNFVVTLKSLPASEQLLLVIDYDDSRDYGGDKKGNPRKTSNYMYDFKFNLLDSGINITADDYVNNLYSQDSTYLRDTRAVFRDDGSIDSTLYFIKDGDEPLFDEKNRQYHVARNSHDKSDTITIGTYANGLFESHFLITGLKGNFHIHAIWDNHLYLCGEKEYANKMYRIEMKTLTTISVHAPYENYEQIVGPYDKGLLFNVSKEGDDPNIEKYAFVEWPEK